jgi:hypothetical protein
MEDQSWEKTEEEKDWEKKPEEVIDAD